ncbi:MAG: DnaD domain protein [Clostridia bacterium]|nr:DnaD domain protein [Clostridia bacterium]
MKINIKYGRKILNLPAKIVKIAPSASKEDLCVIISLFAYSDYLDNFESVIGDFSEKIGVGINKIHSSLAFWAENGVISVEGLNIGVESASSISSAPTYTGAQISKFVEENKTIGTLFKSCQSIMGKDFNTHDHNNIIRLKNYFSFSDEYIMLLLAHCVELGKDNWKYITKTATNLYEEGIDTYRKLEEHFAKRKNALSLESKVRDIFGIGARELTPTEKTKIGAWSDAELDIDFIREAYNITIAKTQKASIAYTAKIIENWLSSGIRTAEDAKANEAQYKKNSSISTFDTDDFFDAALRRSYKDK